MDNQKQEEAFSFLKDRKNILFFVKAVVVKQPLFFTQDLFNGVV